jgi:hypothetical protein
LKIEPVPTYRSAYGVIQFEPVRDAPGCTHRVVVNGSATRLWVPAGQSVRSTRTARFYFRVWRALAEGLPKYHYVDRGQDPPLPVPAGQDQGGGS